MLAIKSELENIPLSDTQRDMLLAMDNVLEQVWTFRNTPVPDRCMDPENISEVVYYFLQDKGAGYRADLLYNRAKAEFDARMEEIAALPPKEILDHAYEKVIKEEFLGELEQGLDEWETDTLLTYPQPLAALYTEWMDNDFLLGQHPGNGGENSGETGGGSPPLRVPCQWGAACGNEGLLRSSWGRTKRHWTGACRGG